MCWCTLVVLISPCAQSLLLAYMVRRGNRPRPLFIFQDGRPLMRPCFVVEVSKALLAAGIDPKPYSGHSFRTGAATTAARQGVEDSTNKKACVNHVYFMSMA